MVRADAEENVVNDQEAPRLAIWQLAEHLRGHQLVAEPAQSEPVLVVLGAREQGTTTLTIRCGTRSDDGGTLWFWSVGEDATTPLAPVDRLIDAVTGILGERRIRDVPTDLGWTEVS